MYHSWQGIGTRQYIIVDLHEISYTCNFTYYCASFPSLVAILTYSSLVFATNSGQPNVWSCEEATLDAKVSPEKKFILSYSPLI